ncbi:MAG: endoribonuclease ysh1 [Watsoniomyces obsoletus]|nr:MAG: endoribonuclease ysh1 [Watsoniomyces obsoletus]
MSTPSTATATNPPPHLHYGFTHHQGYQHPGPTYNANSAFLGSSPLVNNAPYGYPPNGSTSNPIMNGSHNSVVPRPLQPRAPATATAAPAAPSPPEPSATPSSRKRARNTNWHEFYKNGLPKEVIVIDDDTPPPIPTTHEHPVNGRSRPTTQQQPAQKKRRTDGAHQTYEPVWPAAQPSASASNGTHSAGAHTISTDRTTSAIHTTAATSMGSHVGPNGVHVESYDDVQIVGHKRKRTRLQVADEAKKLEMERQGGAYRDYYPPPNPPMKAKDVFVKVVQDYSSTRHQKVDDDDGHYIVKRGTMLADRYEVSRLLGQGTFGKVVEAYDTHKHTKCAIKIIRSIQKYRDASRIELRVLATLALNDKDNRNKCIHLQDCFDFRNHICIVTNLLDMSVFDFLKTNNFVPFPNSHIQSFARQLFTSVAFLHDLNLIHTDLKPENILLVDSSYQTFTYDRKIPSSTITINRTAQNRKVLFDTEIRLIDFGSATFQDEYHSSVVSTRHYRAPEIILGLGWSYPCDIWSIGCILVEFFTGDALFQTHDNLEHLAMMESVCDGKIDLSLIKQVYSQGRMNSNNPALKYFVRRSRLDYPNVETNRASKKYVKAMKRLSEIIPQNSRFNKQFLDLLRRIFLYDPKSRITAKDALKHPWFKETIMDDGAEAARLRMERARAGAGPTATYGR